MSVEIRRLEQAQAEGSADRLGEILADAVEHGASVGFLEGLSVEDAAAWWRESVAPRVGAGAVVLFVAVVEGVVAGTVQLLNPDYPNGRPRAEIAKLLVHSSFRRRGIAEELMTAAQALAATQGRLVLVLDTASADALRLYRRLGWEVAGVIPDFALSTRGRPEPTTFMYRRLG